MYHFIMRNGTYRRLKALSSPGSSHSLPSRGPFLVTPKQSEASMGRAGNMECKQRKQGRLQRQVTNTSPQAPLSWPCCGQWVPAFGSAVSFKSLLLKWKYIWKRSYIKSFTLAKCFPNFSHWCTVFRSCHIQILSVLFPFFLSTSQTFVLSNIHEWESLLCYTFLILMTINA